jgi:hypothetical protein
LKFKFSKIPKLKDKAATTCLVVNEAPELTDVSLNSDEDDEDIDSIVKAYRHAHARPASPLAPGAALLVPCLVLLSSGLGGLASWLAISSEAAGRPLVGLVVYGAAVSNSKKTVKNVLVVSTIT